MGCAVLAAALVQAMFAGCAASPQQQRRDAQSEPDANVGYCGDRLIGPGEGCDDGNLLDGDGCSPFCQVEPGWACVGEPSVCTSLCGNGVLDPGEECEGANLNGQDCASLGVGFTSGTLGCLGSCQFDISGCRMASCGNGVVDPGEECDDGNDSNNDACLNNCRHARCGDGYLWEGREDCDDGNSSNTDACLNTCISARCGDGYVWAGQEECDDGNSSNTDACLNDCTQARCGDGHLWAGQEQCDDGNLVAGDGCSPTCTTEPIPTLYFGTGQPAVWQNKTLFFAGQPHAPTTTIVAAANIDQRNRAVFFTTTTYHEISLPDHQWIASGTLGSRFVGVPGAHIRSALGVSWPAQAESTLVVATQEPTAGSRQYIFDIDNASGSVTPRPENPSVRDWSADPLAPLPSSVKAEFVTLANPHIWTDQSPEDLCDNGIGHSQIGPYRGVLTTSNALHLQDVGYCWVFYIQMPLSSFPPFTVTGAPTPSKIGAMFYSTQHGNRLYVVAVP